MFNSFGALSKLSEKKKNIVVDATTSANTKAKKEKKEKKDEPTAPKDNKAPAAKKTTGAPAKKGEALGAKVGGPSSLAKVAAASAKHAVKEDEFNKKLAEKKATQAERDAKKKEEREAAAKEKLENMTEEERELAKKKEEERKKKEEDDTPKLGMKEYERELAGKRFVVDAKAVRNVDATASKGKTALKAHEDGDGLKIAKTTAAPAASKNKKPEQKTSAKTKKAETVNFMELAAKQGNFGPRRGRNPRGERKQKDEDEQVDLPNDAAFPDLA